MACTLKSLLTLVSLASLATAQHDGKVNDEMGPAAFMWPPDRVWSGDLDNTAPCGSKAAAGNRTAFPLTGGAIALVGQDDYYNTKISISYSDNPSTNSDFATIVEEQSVADLNPGHTCFSIPNARSGITAGANATLQIIYRADWDAPQNQTFYACADITFVVAAAFNASSIPCFNATSPGEDDTKDRNNPTTSAGPGPSSTAAPITGGSGGSSGLSGGAIAGIVIGALAGVALIAGAALFFYRRSQQKKRNSRLARMEDNARRDQWVVRKDSASQNSIQLQNLPVN